MVLKLNDNFFKSENCTKRLQKGCAYCMLKWHAKHLDEMQEIEYFQKNLKDNLERATSLYQDNLDLLNEMNQHPFQSFFSSLKREILSKIEELEHRVSQLYRQQLSLKLEQELNRIKKFNQQYEQCQTMKSTEIFEISNFEQIEFLANKELWGKQELAREQIKNHMITKQILVDPQELSKIMQILEDSIIQIIHQSMGRTLGIEENECQKKKESNSSSQLHSIILSHRQTNQILRKVSSPSIIKAGLSPSPEKSDQTIPFNIQIPQNMHNRSQSYHLMNHPQLIFSPRQQPPNKIIFSQISSPRIIQNKISYGNPLIILNKQ